MTATAKRARLKQERQDAIVGAAVRVFHARGVQAATMDEIAREAGVSKGALYLYFKSKDELFLSIAIDWLEQLQGLVDGVQAMNLSTGVDVVRTVAKTYARHALDNPTRFQVAMSWLNSDYSVGDESPLFQTYRAQIAKKVEFMLSAFERAKKDGSIVSDEPPLRIALQLWGAMHGLILVEQHSDEMARRMPISPPTEGISDAFVDNFLSSFCAEKKRPSHLKSVPPMESEL